MAALPKLAPRRARNSDDTSVKNPPFPTLNAGLYTKRRALRWGASFQEGKARRIRKVNLKLRIKYARTAKSRRIRRRGTPAPLKIIPATADLNRWLAPVSCVDVEHVRIDTAGEITVGDAEGKESSCWSAGLELRAGCWVGLNSEFDALCGGDWAGAAGRGPHVDFCPAVV
jgi:hypothetical protein